MGAETPAVPPTLTILVVEDEHPLRELIRDALETEGYTILDTADPFEAWQMATMRTVHLLLTDVALPRMNGLELADRVEAACPTAKVLMMSGFITPPMKASGRTILSKPFSIDALLSAVHESLSGRSALKRPDPR